MGGSFPVWVKAPRRGRRTFRFFSCGHAGLASRRAGPRLAAEDGLVEAGDPAGDEVAGPLARGGDEGVDVAVDGKLGALDAVGAVARVDPVAAGHRRDASGVAF